MRSCAFFFALMLYMWSASQAPRSFERGPASTRIMKGYNIAWWGTAYGHQWNDGSFSQKKVRELLDLAKRGNAEILRIWLFENGDQWQFEMGEDGNPVALKDEFIPNVIYFLKECEKRGLKVNLTVFDGNSFPHERMPESKLRAWWWNVLNNKYDMGTWVLRNMIDPLFDAIQEEDLQGTVAQVEIMNEIDAAVKYDIFEHDWTSAAAFTCQWYRVFKQRHTTYGVSVGHGGAQKHLINGDLPASCSDYQDLHVYNDSGAIPECDWFSKQAAKGRRFQLGEFGQKNPAFDDELQKTLTARFLNSAVQCGFQSALAWRLEDERPGHNREARHSYTAFGETRPAFQVLKNFQEGGP